MQTGPTSPQTPFRLFSDQEKERSDLFVKFIDVLFAVVIGQSFGLLSSGQGAASWVATLSQNVIALGDAVLFYGLIISSWIGYHVSIKELPIKNVGRFLVDILLLFLYSLALANLSSFANTALILASVFALYCLWCFIRLFEYPDRTVRSEHHMTGRTVLAGAFALLFLGIATLVALYPLAALQGLFLGISFVLVILYRLLLQRKWKKK